MIRVDYPHLWPITRELSEHRESKRRMYVCKYKAICHACALDKCIHVFIMDTC